jgi:hypothetical protein
MKKPEGAFGDFWLLTDEDLAIAIADVQRDMRNGTRDSGVWSFSGGTSTDRVRTLSNLRHEQMRRLTTHNAERSA